MIGAETKHKDKLKEHQLKHDEKLNEFDAVSNELVVVNEKLNWKSDLLTSLQHSEEALRSKLQACASTLCNHVVQSREGFETDK